MKFCRLLYPFFTLCAYLLTGCSSNVFTIRTTPSAANVTLYATEGIIYSGTSDIVDFTIDSKNERQVFGDKNTAELGIFIEKKGYRPLFHYLMLNKDIKMPLIDKFSLEALDTDVQLDVDPPGAKAVFYDSVKNARKGDRSVGVVAIPMGESFGGNYTGNYKEFADFKIKYNSLINFKTDSAIILPWKQNYTSSTARTAFSQVKAIRIEAEDYLPKIEDLTIDPGTNNTKLYQLKKMNTVLKVLSDVDGVEIEDTSSNFGYLGKTPMVRQFSYKECTRDKFVDDNKVPLTLRAYKSGFIDQKIEVAIPWGEEISIKVSLKPRSNQITFQSDPEGVHVYVLRKKKETKYNKGDDGKGKWEDSEIQIEKHLGTTPFTYSIDSSDPLEHNDNLVYKKPGYTDDYSDKFAIGVNSYHKVMKPTVIKER